MAGLSRFFGPALRGLAVALVSLLLLIAVSEIEEEIGARDAAAVGAVPAIPHPGGPEVSQGHPIFYRYVKLPDQVRGIEVFANRAFVSGGSSVRFFCLSERSYRRLRTLIAEAVNSLPRYTTSRAMRGTTSQTLELFVGGSYLKHHGDVGRRGAVPPSVAKVVNRLQRLKQLYRSELVATADYAPSC